jgi:hypothetical protein
VDITQAAVVVQLIHRLCVLVVQVAAVQALKIM